MDHDSDREKKQQEFRKILSIYNITQARAADLIVEETGQKVGARKVRSWLARPRNSVLAELP